MSKSTSAYFAYGCFLRRSQATPEPRSIGPVMPQANAFSGGITPTLTVRCFQMRLSVSRVRSEEHTSELQSLMRISYAVFCLKKKMQLTPKKVVNRYVIIY